jgi:hypothetical protein
MATLRQKRMGYLTNNGLLGFEARPFSKQYSQTQMRQLPYMQRFLRSRRLYISNQRSRGLTNPQIEQAIRAWYRRNGWVDKEGRLDPWTVLRRFRKKEIESGGYVPPKRSHHSVREQITAEQLRQQHAKRRITKEQEARRQDLGKWYDDEMRRIGM